MDILNSAIDGTLKVWFAAFSWGPPVVGLAVLSALAGVAMVWVFGKTSNQARMKQIKRKVYASLFELRVFADEPGVTWRAQKSLFAANLHYMGLALKPALYMIVPMGLLILHLELFYTHAPLPVNTPAVVTMAMAQGWDAASAAPTMTPPAGVEVDGPPVRAAAARQISWRITPKSDVSGELKFTLGGQQIAKRIEAGNKLRFTPAKSVGSSLATLWEPGEPHIAAPGVESIEIAYPDATVDALGVRLNWLVWFFGISILAALVLKKRFGVVI